jgi:YidC/Oxa1 family membrane protein insertase
MTQTRTILLILWLVVAYSLWNAWQTDYVMPRPAVADATTTPSDPTAGIPDTDSVPDAAAAPGTSATPDAVPATTEPATTAAPLTLGNDVLRLRLDANGGTLLAAELLLYARDTQPDSPPVQLLSQESGHYFVAQSGWIGGGGKAPTHHAAFRAETGSQELAEGADSIELPFVWTGDGITVRRVYRLERGSYVIAVRDEISNTGATAWSGSAYHQLQRVVPPSKGNSFTNPEAYSFVGAATYDPQDKFQKHAFDDMIDEPVTRTASAGWIAMLQHYFVAAWVPAMDDASTFSSEVKQGRYLIRSIGPSLQVAPGAKGQSESRLFVGPKLKDHLDATAPGLDLTLDYGIFTIFAKPLHWLLSWLHALTGNWGWAIVLLVVLIKGALFKLSEAQYKSFAKMRRVQPRIEALKERYGEDRQKFQQAMMELYKKEKINPMGGCLPILVQIPIFIALYWVLLEAVELRHAPWIGWIQNLTAPDPYFVLPALNLLTMWLTQKLSPTPGMDPLQKKMMQIMPLVFGVMFAFFPAGLVLYWATNGALGLLQQWIITKRHGEPAKTA